MQKFDFNKIINGKQRTNLKMTVKAVHFSVITHNPVVFGNKVSFGKNINWNGTLRMSIDMPIYHVLHLHKGDRISLNGMIEHNQYCLWVCQPRDIRKRNIMKLMQLYIMATDKRAKRSKGNH